MSAAPDPDAAPAQRRAAGPAEGVPPRGGLWLAPAGAAIGFLASWCGIGGGLFAGPLLHFLRGLPLKASIATALVLVLATALASTAAELLQPVPSLELPVVAALACGVLVGAPAGFAVHRRLPTASLRKVFVVVLALASWRVLAGGAPAAGVGAAGPLGVLAVFLVGLGGGFVAPLIGVGGGLLMVPGLYLLVQGVGFEEARASSLAAAFVAATRSLALHARAGAVRWRDGLLLGGGALAGAAAGVVALERWRAFEAGRTLLGCVLALVAVRFLVESLRGGGAQA